MSSVKNWIITQTPHIIAKNIQVGLNWINLVPLFFYNSFSHFSLKKAENKKMTTLGVLWISCASFRTLGIRGIKNDRTLYRLNKHMKRMWIVESVSIVNARYKKSSFPRLICVYWFVKENQKKLCEISKNSQLCSKVYFFQICYSLKSYLNISETEKIFVVNVCFFHVKFFKNKLYTIISGIN